MIHALGKVAVAVAVMSACAPAAPKLVFTYSEIRGQLPKNGLRFVVMPDPTTQLAEVDVRYEVGSREDPPGKAGLAHLVEHLMFQQRPGGPSARPLAQVLPQLTLNMNAYTNWDTTHFMLNARAGLVDTLVKIEAIRMRDGCRTISEYEFLREREVVRNEIRRGGRSAEARIPELTMSEIYPPDHAYARSIGGDDEQLSTITLRDACEFMRQYYVPERAVVIVAGGFAPEAAIRSIETWFNTLDKRAPVARRAVAPLVVKGGRKTLELDVERPWVTVAWPLPDARTPEGKAAQFGIWSAFLDAARRTEEHDCATQTVPLTLGGREAPIFVIALELSSIDKLDECLDHVWKAARDAGYGWDQGLRERLDDEKNRRKAAFLSSLEPLFGPGGRTDQIADMAQFSRDVDFASRDFYVFHELDKIGKLEVAEVVRATKHALDRDRARVTILAPSKHGVASDRRSDVVFHAATDDEREPPDVDPSEAQRPLQVPGELKVLSRATRFQLDNGMRVVLLPTDAMPVVAAELIFDVGQATTPDSPFLAGAAADLLSMPAGSRSAGQSGMQLRCSDTPDHTICDARGVSLYLNVMITALERRFRAGSYRDPDIAWWQRVTRARYQHKRPQQRLEFMHQQLAAIYGPDHPYTVSDTLVPSAIGKIEQDALTSFRKQHYTAANATLVIAGMFDPVRAQAQVREAFGYWSRGQKDAPVARPADPRTAPVHVGVIGDDDPQVDVALLYPSPAGIAGEQAARLVLTRMLGGQLAQIRSKLGATYGTTARREALLGASAYHLGGAVDAPRAGEALRAMRAGIDALRNGTDFDAMFVGARRKVVQELLAGSTVSTELASRLGQIARFGLDPSYDQDLLRQAAALSPAQVKQLIARELDPRTEVIVLLGDRAAVTRAFVDAGITDAKLVVPDAR
jgi:zinc protease